MFGKGPLHPMLADVEAFIDSLDARSFKALSTGIGLGSARECHRAATPAPTVGVPPQMVGTVFPANFNVASEAVLPPVAAVAVARENPVLRQLEEDELAVDPNLPPAARQALRRRSRRALATAVDLGIVLMSTLMMFVVAGIATSRSGASSTGVLGVMGSDPLRWLGGLNLWQIGLGVVAVFFFYWFVFRVLAGLTLGEFLMIPDSGESAEGSWVTPRND
jgi:hypothetical protein